MVDGVVDGYNLYAKLEQETELRSAIELFESEKIYKFDNVAVFNGSEICVQAAATIFKHELPNDELFESQSWSVRDDVYFRYGLPTLFRMAHEARTNGGLSNDPHFWEKYLPIMGTFLNLWTVMERYMQFAQPSLRSNEENKAKGKMTRNLSALENSDAGKSAYDKVINKNKREYLPAQGGRRSPSQDRYLSQWYRARNNSAHRGKSAYSDYDKVREAALGLSEFLVALLSHEVNGLEFEDLSATSSSSIS